MGNRINTIMQTCFFALAGILPRDEAIALIKESIEKSYARKGPEVVERNFAAVDDTLAHLHQVVIPAGEEQISDYPLPLAPGGSEFVQRVTGEMLAGRGDLIPVSMLPVDGTYPTATSRFEKRDIAREIPIWQFGYLHPVRQLRLCLPPRGAAGQVLPSGLAGDRPRGSAVGARHRQGLPRQPLHLAALSGGLHRLRPVRAGLSGAGRGG